MKKSNHGGKRPGSGRKKRDTKVLYMKVPTVHYDDIKAAAVQKMKDLTGA